jgi:hypothetical protein
LEAARSASEVILMDALIGMWISALRAPFELVGNFLDALENDARRLERDARRGAEVAREDEIERFERRLAELRRG